MLQCENGQQTVGISLLLHGSHFYKLTSVDPLNNLVESLENYAGGQYQIT